MRDPFGWVGGLYRSPLSLSARIKLQFSQKGLAIFDIVCEPYTNSI
jgi:hypothetical protein